LVWPALLPPLEVLLGPVGLVLGSSGLGHCTSSGWWWCAADDEWWWWWCADEWWCDGRGDGVGEGRGDGAPGDSTTLERTEPFGDGISSLRLPPGELGAL
jgi:hypothetical protein